MYYFEFEWKNHIFYVVYQDRGIIALHNNWEKVETYQATYQKSALYEQVVNNFFMQNEVSREYLHLQGTTFQKMVWQTLMTIPAGKVITYTQVAEQLNQPKAVRAVAHAISQNPILLLVPCHRVIGKNGKLTGYSGGLDLKKELLQLENIKYSV